METIKEIKRHLRRGDLLRTAVKAQMTVENLRKTLKRPTAKRHAEAKAALRMMAEENIELGLSPVL